MAETKVKYANAVNLTVASWGTGLAPGQIGASLIVDNATNLYVDVFVGGLLEIGTTTPAAGNTLDVYVYGRYDQATAAALTGGIDALFTGADEEETDGTDLILAHLPLIASLEAESNIGIHFGPTAIAQFFGGVVPESWGLVLHNNGAATMAAGSLAEYIGVTYTSA
jgi:hypothetical protein